MPLRRKGLGDAAQTNVAMLRPMRTLRAQGVWGGMRKRHTNLHAAFDLGRCSGLEKNAVLVPAGEKCAKG